MLNVRMDVETVFNIYKIDYVCTHAFDDTATVGETGEALLITTDEDAARHWFEEAFNRNGDLYDLVHITHMNKDKWVHMDMIHYMYEAEEKSNSST